MTSEIRSVCIYCGSSTGNTETYAQTAKAVGEFLAQENLTMVYGGGDVGLMGITANSCLSAGGRVIGVIPEKLQQLEVGHDKLSELFVVEDMHSRKAKMAELSDAFIALPGGFGTLEELFEVTTWSQLNYHLKPVGLLNIDGYYDHLIRFIGHAVSEGFIRDVHSGLISDDIEVAALFAKLSSARIPRIEEWIQPA